MYTRHFQELIHSMGKGSFRLKLCTQSQKWQKQRFVFQKLGPFWTGLDAHAVQLFSECKINWECLHWCFDCRIYDEWTAIPLLRRSIWTQQWCKQFPGRDFCLPSTKWCSGSSFFVHQNCVQDNLKKHLGKQEASVQTQFEVGTWKFWVISLGFQILTAAFGTGIAIMKHSAVLFG